MSGMNFVKQAISKPGVIIFSKSYCPYCREAKQLFDGLNQKATIHELDEMDNGSQIQEALAEMTKQRTVPNIFINGQHIGGYDKTSSLHQKGQLEPLFKL